MRKAPANNNLKSKYPRIAAEFDIRANEGTKPEEYFPKSNKSVWWLCPVDKRHKYQARISNRTALGRGCPYCAGRKVLEEGSLAIVRPDLAAEWHKDNKTRPERTAPYSHKKVKWLCPNGHTWACEVDDRMRGKSCPDCKSLAFRFPEIAAELHSVKNRKLDPEELHAGTNKIVWWQCPKGHEWKCAVFHRTNLRYKRKCPYCNNEKASKDYSLNALYPEVAEQWHPTKNGKIKPEKVLPKSNKKYWWQCKKGHEWKARVSSRTDGNGCPDCHVHISKRQQRVYTELKSLFPDAIMEYAFDSYYVSDVYIPSLKLAIEVDGYYYHKTRMQLDNMKDVVLYRQGVTVLRLRETPLEKTLADCIFHPKRIHDKKLINQLLELIKKNTKLSADMKKAIAVYLKQDDFRNDGLYRELEGKLLR